MIFVTVGTQLPFPRLIDAVVAWGQGAGEEVAVQAGTAAPATPPPGVAMHAWLDPVAFERLFRSARVVVAHAGIGSVLSARRFERPLVVMPRKHDLGEHRNDHQLATARALEGSPGLYIAWEAADLPALLARSDLEPAVRGAGRDRDRLIDRLRAEISR